MRAAMLGGTAYAARKAGEAAEQERYAEAEQDQRLHALEAQSAPAPAPTGGTDVVGELTKLKGLLDSGALTQDEFEAAKRRLLGT